MFKISNTRIRYSSKANAISYIIGVFKECYAVGDPEIYVESDGGCIERLCTTFVFHQINSVYLHSLFVKNNYEGQGIGTKLLNVIKNRGLDAYLLCDYTKNKYYETVVLAFKYGLLLQLEMILKCPNTFIIAFQ